MILNLKRWKMKQQTLEQTLVTRIQEAKAITQEKLFKEFCKCTNDDERKEIGAKMEVLDKVIYNLNIIIRKTE